MEYDKAAVHLQAQEVLSNCTNVWDLTIPWVRQYWSIDVLRRYHEAGYTYASLTVQDMPASFEGVQKDLADFKKMVEPHSDWLCFADDLVQTDEAREQGKLALGVNVQDTELVHDDLSRLEVLKSAGVKHMLLAYQVRNRAADGCAEPADAGLSLFGRRLVKAMNEAGIVVDASHVGRQSSLDAIEYSETPVIFSHSGAKSVCRHIRNIDDDQIRACAEAGGVIGIVGIGAFLGDPAASSDAVFKHLDHMVQLVGPSHVGIGTDFIDNMAWTWQAMQSSKSDAWRDPYGTQLYEGDAFRPEQLIELVGIMISNGYTRADIEAILGANFRRIYQCVHGPKQHKSDKQLTK